jgi:hypothetical protein
VGGDEDDWKVVGRAFDRALELKAADVRHADIEYEARCRVRRWARKKLASGCEALDAVTRGAEQRYERLAHRKVIIDHKYDRVPLR